MKVKLVLFGLISLACFSCSNQSSDIVTTPEVVEVPTVDSGKFSFSIEQDTSVKNGESITKYKNGQFKLQGMMKDGKRDGLWKSFYENGLPWSETTFTAGILDGKTTTWYENGQKRYTGAYKNGVECGSWTYWDENGKEMETRNYDKK